MDDPSIRLHNKPLAELYAYWLGKKGPRIAPARAAIWPEEMSAFLPHLYLVDVVGILPRFRYRLVGTMIDEICPTSLTGKYLDEIELGRPKESIIADYRTTVAEYRPMIRRWSVTADSGQVTNYERLVLPLSADGARVDMLLGGLAFDQAADNPAPA